MNDLLRKRYLGQLLRSISLKKKDYSPQSIESSEAARPARKYRILATTPIVEQAPSYHA